VTVLAIAFLLRLSICVRALTAAEPGA